MAINQIKVGDMVLSHPEHNPDVPNEYKRVLSTFKSEEKQRMYYLTYEMIDADQDQDGKSYVFCTDSHPFWTKECIDFDDQDEGIFQHIGWRPANLVDAAEGHVLETYDGKLFFVNQLLEEGERYLAGFAEEKRIAVPTTLGNGAGTLFDFRSGRPIAIGGGGIDMSSRSAYFNNLARNQEQITYPATDDDPDVQFYLSLTKTFEYYCDHVYGIEVEDNHTYFVGHEGVWVHDVRRSKNNDSLKTS
jgi:transcription-repair coupling factor (superfamily II helicase)